MIQLLMKNIPRLLQNDNIFQQIALGKLYTQVQKNKVEYLSKTKYETVIIDQNKDKIIQLSKSIARKLYAIVFVNHILDMITQIQTSKER